jgi:uncharacterized membrane protein
MDASTTIGGRTGPPPRPLDLRREVRVTVVIVAGLLTALTGFGVARAALGLAPPGATLRPVVAVHLFTVLPAIPLGAYLLFVRKGGPRHRWLGRLWLTLMGLTAVATLFIRDIKHGGFSLIHLFTLLTFIAIPRALWTARRRQFTQHRRTMLGFYVGALLIAGYFTFLPGRLMWEWAFG